MTLNDRIASFEILGIILRKFPDPLTGHEEKMALLARASGLAEKENPWFTQDQIRRSFNVIGESMRHEKFAEWLRPYNKMLLSSDKPVRVGVVMAGNIPAVGFHDLLCVLITGNTLVGKLSSLDRQLLSAFVEILRSLHNGWEGSVIWKEGSLDTFDCLIATGSNSSSRYFDYYFRKYPHIIRKNRNSIAVLSGDETGEELEGLADDILSFFGMGCRNVSKIFIPENYDFSSLIQALSSYSKNRDHDKFRNNYDFRKTMFMIDQKPMIDAGNLLLTPSRSIASPVAVLYYEYYTSLSEVEEYCRMEIESIQCIVSKNSFPLPSIPPGFAQRPELWDYADGIDTMELLLTDFLP
jgi:hypothetical protein